jgi:hypothetical protein
MQWNRILEYLNRDVLYISWADLPLSIVQKEQNSFLLQIRISSSSGRLIYECLTANQIYQLGKSSSLIRTIDCLKLLQKDLCLAYELMIEFKTKKGFGCVRTTIQWFDV